MADDNWDGYSRLVLKELETLGKGIFTLNIELQEIKKELALTKDREDRVEEVRIWKERVSEVLTPSQLKELVDQVEELSEFKTKAVTIFLIVQFIVTSIALFGRYLHL